MQIVKKEDSADTEETADEKKDEVVRGIKRRASATFSDADEEFKGFDSCEQSSLEDYDRVVGKLFNYIFFLIFLVLLD